MIISPTISLVLVCAFYVCFSRTQAYVLSDDDGRIIGGEPADIRDIPYQLSIRVCNNHWCGASIIGLKWAISAAHCVAHLNAKNFTVRAGTSDVNDGGINYEVTKIIIHPKYDYHGTDFDIALIQIEQQFDVSLEGIKSIALAETPPQAGDLAQTSGWGVAEHSSFPDQLLRVGVPIVDHSICQDAYAADAKLPKVTDRMICAGYLETGGKDACHGDSGGPLVVNNKLVGIVSWGNGCALPRFPGVYTNISNLRKWIKDNSEI